MSMLRGPLLPLCFLVLAVTPAIARDEAGWFAFTPKDDAASANNPIDLRSLNEKVAGDNGVIGVRGGQFIHSKTGQPVVFWAVNGPASKDVPGLRAEARKLAKYGVNMVRVHGGYFKQSGEIDPSKVRHAQDVVETMKAEGIYSHFSIYFPLWLDPKPGLSWLPGYDGKKHPFAALYFNKDFQERYRDWWKALLLTPDQKGKRLVDDPAVAGLEIINEDSYFFWTFSTANIPDMELRVLEAQFANWLVKRHGSLEAAFKAWNGQSVPRDNRNEGRVGFRPLWNIAHERTRRDQDTAAFLLESQRGFYDETTKFLRGLGFKGVITASNWATAEPAVLGPLEKYSYAGGDFIDRHGYFSCLHKGPNAEWSIRDGHTYANRSALRFDPETPGKPKQFLNPVMDPSYDGKPSMISETTFTRPNRYRTEAPLYFAAYGSLQGSDAIVHFAEDGAGWQVKPNFWMQPWTLMSPAMIGQFPAAARIFRQGLVSGGELLVDIDLSMKDLLALRGTPMPQDASFDELRLKDVPQNNELEPGKVVDPLVHYAGKTNVNFTDNAKPARLANLKPYIDRENRRVRSSTGELELDYGRGVLTIDAPKAQGVCGALNEAGEKKLKDLSIESALELGNIVAVSLDDAPLATSKKILLQVMSEEKTSDFRTEPASNNTLRIVSIGHDPWLVRDLQGVVRFTRPDAQKLKVLVLDLAGNPTGDTSTAAEIRLRPRAMYYLIEPE